MPQLLSSILVKKLCALCLLFIILSVGFWACKKETTTTTSINSLTGSISLTGIIAADGCGWLIKINNVTYHPDNLPADFQKDNLTVIISGTITNDKFYCGNASTTAGLPILHITSIVKK